jgi:hypothetical protein
MEKIEQINLGDTQWELNNALEKYKPDTIAKVLDKLVEIIEKQGEIIDRLNEQPEEKYKKGDKVKLTLADKDGWIAGEFKVVGVEAEQLGEVQGYRDGLQYARNIQKDTPEEYRSPEVLGAIARGYSTERNRSKVLDPELCEDIGIEVQQLLDKAREEGRREALDIVGEMRYKGDIKKFKHIKTTYDCKTVEEYIWFRVLHDNHYDELVSLRDYLKQQEKRLLMAKAQVFITLVIIITHMLLLIYFKP